MGFVPLDLDSLPQQTKEETTKPVDLDIDIPEVDLFLDLFNPKMHNEELALNMLAEQINYKLQPSSLVQYQNERPETHEEIVNRLKESLVSTNSIEGVDLSDLSSLNCFHGDCRHVESQEARFWVLDAAIKNNCIAPSKHAEILSLIDSAIAVLEQREKTD